MTREDDINLLLAKILDIGANYDEGCRTSWWSCPFCMAETDDRYDICDEKDAMRYIGHKYDCPYLIAKDLATNIIEVK